MAIAKNIVRTSYVFEKDATTNSSIRIGFTNGDFRLHKFEIKDSSSVNYSKEFNNKMFIVNTVLLIRNRSTTFAVVFLLFCKDSQFPHNTYK